jgi:N-acetylglucosamine-6-phosphate deacetylase
MWFEGRMIESGHVVRLEVTDGVIGRIEPLNAPTASDIWIAPGLFDIQVNGYAGHDINAFDVTPEIIIALTHTLWQRGITAFCPTVITQSEAHICHALQTIVSACKADPLIAHAIPCIHVEGPYISSEDGPRGAHPLVHVRPPDLNEYERWQQAAEGRIGLITLAPEYPGTREYVSTVTADGVVISLGHTAAEEEQIRIAVEAGAYLSTHLGNGAHSLIKRHPNYIWEQLAEDRLMASFICDGHHLPPAVMKAMIRAKGVERSILVSDSVAIAGLEPGMYETAVGGKVELLPSGRLNLYGTPYLAGSASSLPECIAAVVHYTDVTLAEAVKMASTNPARLLGLDRQMRRGSVRSGASADLTLFKVDPACDDLIIEATVVHGELVYQRGEA